jgi:3-oxoacyl-[acyl-carrier-protein] synthase-3
MGIKIQEISIYHPEKRIENQCFINKYGQDIEKLLNHLGRKSRYLVDNNTENALTMGIEVANSCLKKANIKASELDIIVFVSDSIEYLIPTNALLIREAIGACNCDLTYDINDNCIGMITAIDNIATYMKSKNKYKKSLIVGSSYGSMLAKSDCELVNSTAGDGAAAILLTSDDENGGVLNSAFHTDSKNHKYMVFPECGMSHIYDEDLPVDNKKYAWVNHDVSYFSDEWVNLINKLLKEENESIMNIKHFLFSQFSHADIKDTLSKLNVEVSSNTYTFIADEYGYTGCTSPFFALNKAIENKKINKGDLVMFCSVGSGYTMGAFLYKF